jgi:hypothetical protein
MSNARHLPVLIIMYPVPLPLARLLFELAFISLIPNANNNLLPPAHYGEVEVGFRAGYMNSYLIDKQI